MSNLTLEEEKAKLKQDVIKLGHSWMKYLYNPKNLKERDFCYKMVCMTLIEGSFNSVYNIGLIDILFNTPIVNIAPSEEYK